MVSYDYSKLYGRMRECGVTQENLAAEVGISAVTLNYSLTNKRDFRQNEIATICKCLEISSERIPEYFFRHKLEKSQEDRSNS